MLTEWSSWAQPLPCTQVVEKRQRTREDRLRPDEQRTRTETMPCLVEGRQVEEGWGLKPHFNIHLFGIFKIHSFDGYNEFITC